MWLWILVGIVLPNDDEWKLIIGVILFFISICAGLAFGYILAKEHINNTTNNL